MVLLAEKTEIDDIHKQLRNCIGQESLDNLQDKFEYYVKHEEFREFQLEFEKLKNQKSKYITSNEV